MLGLVSLEQTLRPKTTIDKLFFLIEHVPNLHVPTTTVAFGAFAALVMLKYIKGSFKSGWIRGIPEVLIIVIVSTCAFWDFPGLFVPLKTHLSIGFTVLCEEFGWDKDGVDILGPVSVKTGSAFFAFPLRAENWKYLTQTTSTAMSVPPPLD